MGLLPPLTTSLPFGGTLSLSSTLSVSSYTVAFPFLIMCLLFSSLLWNSRTWIFNQVPGNSEEYQPPRARGSGRPYLSSLFSLPC